jgi:hypothetical protein
MRQPAISPTPLTRYLPYHGVNLSRPAPPSELIERHSPYGIRSLAEGHMLGAYFAEAIGDLLNLPTEGARSRSIPGALIVLALKSETTCELSRSAPIDAFGALN